MVIKHPLFTTNSPWVVLIVIALVLGTIAWRLYRAVERGDED